MKRAWCSAPQRIVVRQFLEDNGRFDAEDRSYVHEKKKGWSWLLTASVAPLLASAAAEKDKEISRRRKRRRPPT